MPGASKNRTFFTIASTIAGAVVLGSAAAIIVAYSGVVDVAATNPPSALTSWLLRTTRNHSVARRSKGIQVPDLDAASMLEVGADHYQEMCVGCHGAPGVEPGEAAEGLEPPPPKLYEGPAMTKASAAETFWIVKNGIKMTGMPAFGKTHGDEKIWAIVAFVEHLHDMTPAEYEKRTASSGHDEADDDDER